VDVFFLRIFPSKLDIAIGANVVFLHKITIKFATFGVNILGVIRTDQWLDEDFEHPEKLCQKAEPEQVGGEQFYRYLQTFGMYTPSRYTKANYTKLKDRKVWELIERWYQKYRKLWSGPESNIYIFPIQMKNPLFSGQSIQKSGVSFPNKIYLFLAPVDDIKEWEALFVHEYHHVTRMHYLNKDLMDYTLLDSLVFEGLAEHAVLEYCGEKYLAQSTKQYADRQLLRYWKSHFKDNLSRKKKESIHDQLLYGKSLLPNMIGYALGFKLIEDFKKNEGFKTTRYIKKDSSVFLQGDYS